MALFAWRNVWSFGGSGLGHFSLNCYKSGPGDSLLNGLRPSTHEYDEYSSLRDSNRRIIIPYV
jgi:hypothetical protein